MRHFNQPTNPKIPTLARQESDRMSILNHSRDEETRNEKQQVMQEGTQIGQESELRSILDHNQADPLRHELTTHQEEIDRPVDNNSEEKFVEGTLGKDVDYIRKNSDYY